MTYNLILLRHGNSVWNQKNLFTGWVDVDLSDQGRAEAKRAGELLGESGLLPDVLYTSVLKRAINTAHIALNAAERSWIDVKRDWRLNERHYGALQGKDKAQTLAEYGPEMFQTWRRSFDTPPPPLDDSAEFSQAADPTVVGWPDECARHTARPGRRPGPAGQTHRRGVRRADRTVADHREPRLERLSGGERSDAQAGV